MKKINKKLVGIVTALGLSGMLLTGCTQAERASHNLAQESDNFNVVRKVTVIDAITNDVMFQMTGRLSINTESSKKLVITVENSNGSYQKHIIGLSDNVTYVVSDVTKKNVSKYNYEINYNPKMWKPATFKNID
ncbi:hypothetical protein [Ligilactobacillus equi]|uniref:Lipoprotein n=1 Tax=Ligilactobacillus equi DSM 15833 = JCM 10991 TaxID=1423740 RepID=A0A0R1TL98_9LACO|nr:hypothetical protein [Ligilactobacillus equi]KRL81785.1 hypothetical protein FC36_GL001377 [Ligilactobacillus equi DSM 15833 = JCM 10991]